jgi:hypothetical protein
MVDDATWPKVESAMNNFAVMMGGVMLIAACKASAGDQPGGPVPEAGPQVRALVADRLGKGQLDAAGFARVRAALEQHEADELLAACSDFAGDLPHLSEPLNQDDMLAYIQRGGPGDPTFDAFLHRFMQVAQRIQQIVEGPAPR